MGYVGISTYMPHYVQEGLGAPLSKGECSAISTGTLFRYTIIDGEAGVAARGGGSVIPPGKARRDLGRALVTKLLLSEKD